MTQQIHIIGGGLAGSEAAWRSARPFVVVRFIAVPQASSWLKRLATEISAHSSSRPTTPITGRAGVAVLMV